MSVDDQLALAWRDERAPSPDAITFNDGRMTLVNVRHFTQGDSVRIQAKPIADTTLRSFLSYNPDSWVHLDPIYRQKTPSGLVVVGGGSMGADGFVAHLSEVGDLRWLAFFSSSEAFCHAHGSKDGIHARTVSNQNWLFPAGAPERIQVSAVP
jgi:hypothetical protein